MTLFTILTLCNSFTCAPFTQLSATQVYSQRAKSCVTIESKNSLGSGVFVDNGRLLVTASHVVQDSFIAKTREYNISLKLLTINKAADIAVFAANPPSKHSTELSLVDQKPGSTAYTISSPLGLFSRSISDGIVSGSRTVGSLKLIQFTSPISQGSSGGGVFDSLGKLTGIISSFAKDSQNINFAVSASTLRREIQRAKAVLSLDEHRRQVSFTKSAGQYILGTYGQARTVLKIYSAPSETSRQYYTAKALEYFCINPSSDPQWKRVLMSNNAWGYALSSKIEMLPYAVTTKNFNADQKATPPAAVGAGNRDATVGLALGFLGAKVGQGQKIRSSGHLVKLLFACIGVTIPESAKSQSEIGTAVDRLENLQVGDRLYLYSERRDAITRVAIYLGDGTMIMANEDAGVTAIYDISPKFREILVAARR